MSPFSALELYWRVPCKYKLPLVVHWQVVVNDDISPNPVYAQVDDPNASIIRLGKLEQFLNPRRLRSIAKLRETRNEVARVQEAVLHAFRTDVVREERVPVRIHDSVFLDLRLLENLRCSLPFESLVELDVGIERKVKLVVDRIPRGREIWISVRLSLVDDVLPAVIDFLRLWQAFHIYLFYFL